MSLYTHSYFFFSLLSIFITRGNMKWSQHLLGVTWLQEKCDYLPTRSSEQQWPGAKPRTPIKIVSLHWYFWLLPKTRHVLFLFWSWRANVWSVKPFDMSIAAFLGTSRTERIFATCLKSCSSQILFYCFVIQYDIHTSSIGPDVTGSWKRYVENVIQKNMWL